MTTVYSAGHFAISSSALSGCIPAAPEFYQQLKSSVSWKQLYLLVSLLSPAMQKFLYSCCLLLNQVLIPPHDPLSSHQLPENTSLGALPGLS